VVSDDGVPAKHCSSCVIRIAPGEKVRPRTATLTAKRSFISFADPAACWVAGEARRVREVTVVLFPQGAVHMLHNTGDTEMKVVCFFAPSTNLENYQMHEGVDFPD